jgi:outer membrane receptor protein involved in Fe transport
LRFSGLIKGLEINSTVYNVLNTKYYSQEPDPNIPHVPEQGKRQFIVRMSYRF